MEKEFLDYLRKSLSVLYDYFLSNAWLHYQTNIRILSTFIYSCAHAYPDVKGDLLFNNPFYKEATPKMLWMSNARKLIDIAQEIHGRKRQGTYDAALSHRAHSKIRALESTIPDKWIGRTPNIPEEVVRILDERAVYYNVETNR